jgi:hypothetical protein
MMATSKEKNKTGKKAEDEMKNPSINKDENDSDEEIYSDGSGEAFEQTEEVNEDNFDDLKEK